MTKNDGLGPRHPFLLYPFNMSQAVLFTLVGLGLVLSEFTVKVTAVQQLPVPLVIMWSVFLIAAGPLIIAGLSWKGPQHLAHAIERAGLYLGAAAWTTYSICVMFFMPLSLVPVGQGFAIAAACIARAYSLHRVDQMIRHIDCVANSAERS